MWPGKVILCKKCSKKLLEKEVISYKDLCEDCYVENVPTVPKNRVQKTIKIHGKKNLERFGSN